MSTATPQDADTSLQPPGEPPTVATFSPASSSLASYAYSPRQRTTILIHQKSPLLLATPPQITRALAYSHPFLLPINKLAGLLSWTTGDPWESFLLLVGFWVTTLYGDVLLRWAGPVLFVLLLTLGLYSRRYSPLSSTGWASEQAAKTHQRKESEGKLRHQKSLDEIVEALKLLTSRCNILLDPFLRLTDFLSTQIDATSATTRPALITLFLRILVLTPVWYTLTLGPLHVITSRRVILSTGTTILSWHSRPARISRTILWRSLTVRRVCSIITGLQVTPVQRSASIIPKGQDGKPLRDVNRIAAALAMSRRNSDFSPNGHKGDSIRFTFTVYENQRRWIGIGWTSSMLAYERVAWTDDQLNPASPKDKFELPEVEGGVANWQWFEGSTWVVEGGDSSDDSTTIKDTATSATTPGKGKEAEDTGGWIYYDAKWRFGRPQDGWGRYTRRRKWCRDAELVEATPALPARPTLGKSNRTTSPTTATTARPTTLRTATTMNINGNSPTATRKRAGTGGSADENASTVSLDSTTTTIARKRTWFGTPSTSATGNRSRANSKGSEAAIKAVANAISSIEGVAGSGADDSGGSLSLRSAEREGSRDGDEDDGYVPLSQRGRLGAVQADWGVAEDVGMELG